MGPWQIRSDNNPFTPGLSFEKLSDLVAKGRVRRDTIIRGPTTRQFWAFACNTPGVAALLGECHSCHRPVRPNEFVCRFCEASLSPPTDRQHLGLAPVQLLPGQAPAATIASSGMGQLPERPAVPTTQPPPSAPAPTVRLLAASVAAATSPTIASSASATTPAPANDQATRRLRQQIEFLKLMMVIMGVVCAGLIIILVAISNMKKTDPRRPMPAATDDAPSAPAATEPAP
jgi:hypothetical protein